MDAKTQEATRDVSHYIAYHFTRGRQKWFAFITIYTTEMDAKPVFDCLLGAFLFGELPRLDLFTVRNQMIFGSMSVSGKLPTHPSPRLAFWPKREVSINVRFGVG